MKMKKLIIGLIIVFCIGIGGVFMFRKNEKKFESLYPRSNETFVGDPMPYYNGKDFLVYYLEDHRDGEIGFHPFSLLRTRDFYQYEDEGEVIPYENEEDSIERALGTGSIIRDKKGKYHAFYTGHNDSLVPKERIMHAISNDGVNWKKIPEDTFEASETYDANDFRDPFVFWNSESEEYWMLITTRANQTGVIALYASKDLENWDDRGIFFSNDLGNDSNLECPSVVEYQGKWYLTFSDQWDKRVVHYRVSHDLTEPFKSVEETDYFDAAGFYAGRLTTDGRGLYLIGWIPTKENHDDQMKYNWAGNLAVHQLVVNESGNLSPSLPEKAEAKIKKKHIDLSQEQTLDLEGETIIYQGTYRPSKDEKVIVSVGNQNHLVLDFNANKMAYYNDSIERTVEGTSVTEISFDEAPSYEFKMVHEKDIFVVYLGGKALSNRIYAGQTSNIAISHWK